MEMNCLRGGMGGDFGALGTLTDGISLNEETFEYDPYGNIYFAFDMDGDDPEIIVVGLEVADDFSKDIDFCIEANGKRFIYHAKLVSLQAYATGIDNVNVNANVNNRIYDLSGRQVVKTQKGVYIQNGKKVIK